MMDWALLIWACGHFTAGAHGRMNLSLDEPQNKKEGTMVRVLQFLLKACLLGPQVPNRFHLLRTPQILPSQETSLS